ncbi:MAG: diaminopimelate epimerase [Thermodesulfobacteriota bacterium]|nr:diaminopimelate epimerase [Thermodesulfobacteriota bacterium]
MQTGEHAQSFTKMSGTGNDFIVINAMDRGATADWGAFARKYCPRRIGIGADGVLVLEADMNADFCLRIFNADGSEAEMCGNGARCAAAFALRTQIAPKTMSFKTLAGIIHAEADRNEVTLEMTLPEGIEGPIELGDLDPPATLYYADTGVPHAIVFTDDIDHVDVESRGRAIRMHEHFAPRGTNVDFVQIMDSTHIRVRTYERGVEAETLACGTGSVASALMSTRFNCIDKSPVNVSMSGGRLSIGFEMNGEVFSHVSLTGPVESIYSAEVVD